MGLKPGREFRSCRRARAQSAPLVAGLIFTMVVATTVAGSALAAGAAGPKANAARVKTGTAGRDVMHGSRRDDLMYGFRGPDRLSGRGGNDTLRGATGPDKLIGGSGNDTLIGGFSLQRGKAGQCALVRIRDDAPERDTTLHSA